MIGYLAAFAEGDARTGLNLLELAMNLSIRQGATKDGIKAALTKSLVYDRAGDQHYDTISAFHKSIRGSDADAALYYLARMIQSGTRPQKHESIPRIGERDFGAQYTWCGEFAHSNPFAKRANEADEGDGIWSGV